VALGVTVEEGGKDAVDRLRGRRDPQNSAAASPEQLSAFLQRVHCAEDRAAVSEQLLAFSREYEPAPHTVEKADSKLCLEVFDLAGQRGLGDVEEQGSL
jgi:hypothetical protein